MIGGLLGGLVGGMARGAMSRGMSRPMGGGMALAGLTQRDDDRRKPSPALPQPTIGNTGPIERPTVSPDPQVYASQPSIGAALLDGPSIGGTQNLSQPSPQVGPQSAQQTPAIGPASGQAQQESAPPITAPQSERPIEPRPPVVEDAQPLDVDEIDVTQGVQEPEIDQQNQNIPPLRYWQTPNALPAVEPRAQQVGSDDIGPSPDAGYSFRRSEGVESYAPRFTYRRR